MGIWLERCRTGIAFLPWEPLNGHNVRNAYRWITSVLMSQPQQQSLIGFLVCISPPVTLPYPQSDFWFPFQNTDVTKELCCWQKLLWKVVYNVKRPNSSLDIQPPFLGSDFPNVSDCSLLFKPIRDFHTSVHWLMPSMNHNLSFWPFKVQVRRQLSSEGLLHAFSWNQLLLSLPFPST